MTYFKYGKKEMDYLSDKDKRMAALIAEHGKIKRRINPDLFDSLISSIVAQQISSKAATTVNQRLKALTGIVSPKTIDHCSHSEIQQCGMTGKKASYIKNAAEAILSGKIVLDDFDAYEDDKIISQLKSLPGIGVWTAEMLLLHSFQRPNVFSFDDLIIRRNLSKLHHRSIVNRAEFDRYRKRYSPFGSVAMIYLWKMEG
jgi:3-methyladenine DNA glycosylase/8-oxoguanine DNA glycosylase